MMVDRLNLPLEGLIEEIKEITDTLAIRKYKRKNINEIVSSLRTSQSGFVTIKKIEKFNKNNPI